jgi:hypothetical protein
MCVWVWDTAALGHKRAAELVFESRTKKIKRVSAPYLVSQYSLEQIILKYFIIKPPI